MTSDALLMTSVTLEARSACYGDAMEGPLSTGGTGARDHHEQMMPSLGNIALSCYLAVAMEIALFIQNLQEERAEVALFIFTKQSAGASFNLTALRTNKRFAV